jgi:fatty acid desaturase
MLHTDYVRILKPLLPKEAFRANPGKLWQCAIHLFVLLCAWGLFRITPVVLWPVLSLVIGHSLACLGFFAHELSHGSVVRATWWRYSLELIVWGVNFISPTMWRKLHNESHHRQTNAMKDPDRRFVHSEETPLTRLYSLLIFPNKRLKSNLLPFLHFVTYILRHSVAVFYKDGTRPEITTFRPAYTRVDKTCILGEFMVLAGIQVGIYFAVGGTSAWIWAGPVGVLSASSILQIYLFTNHFLNPLGDGTDPLSATTSVQVPRLINALHFNFSYHTEHHLFPGMDSTFYPVLSELLHQHFPERYHTLPITQAWSRLVQIDLYAGARWDIPTQREIPIARHSLSKAPQ